MPSKPQGWRGNRFPEKLFSQMGSLTVFGNFNLSNMNVKEVGKIFYACT